MSDAEFPELKMSPEQEKEYLQLMMARRQEWLDNSEIYIDGTGQRVRVHKRNSSCDEHCCIHNPSDHALKDAPTHWRGDRGIMERLCEHGVGHPDPDGLAFIGKTRGQEAMEVESVHGCDGCCRLGKPFSEWEPHELSEVGINIVTPPEES